jgi:hypothetical protein
MRGAEISQPQIPAQLEIDGAMNTPIEQSSRALINSGRIGIRNADRQADACRRTLANGRRSAH